MAIAASCIFEIRSAGADTSGGAFAGDASLAIPSAPSVSTATTGGTVAAGSYYVVISYNNNFSVGGQISSQTLQVTTGTTSTITVTSPPASAGTVSWNVYIGTASGGPYFPQGTGLTIGNNRVITTTPPSFGVQPPGTDRSQSDTPFVTFDGTIKACTSDATGTTLTMSGSSPYVPTAADVGNIVQITGGSNFSTGFYHITAWTSTTWTIDRDSTSGNPATGMTGAMGGALATPGMACSAMVNGNSAYVLGGDYVMSSSSNVAGGRIAPATGSQYWYGRGSSRSDTSTKPRFLANANSMTCVTFAANIGLISNVEFGNNGSFTSVTGVSTTQSHIYWEYCKASGIATGFSTSGTVHILGCLALNCTTAGFTGNGTTQAEACVASGCVTGFGSFGNLIDCLAINGTGIGFDLAANGATARNCTAYGNTGGSSHGFRISSSFSNNQLINCLSVSNGGTSFALTGASIRSFKLVNCAAYGNGTDAPTTGFPSDGFITLSADPFTNAAGSDFSLNDTIGAGASLRAAGYPTAFPGLSPTNYFSVGAYQDGNSSNVAGAARVLNSMIIQGMGVI